MYATQCKVKTKQFSSWNLHSQYLHVHICLCCNATYHTPIHATLPRDRVRWRHLNIWRLFQERNLEMELLGYPLGWRVAVARPHDVLDVQTLLLPGLPDTDLENRRTGGVFIALSNTFVFKLKMCLIRANPNFWVSLDQIEWFDIYTSDLG